MNKLAKINSILWIGLFTAVQLFSVNIENNIKLHLIIAITIILGLTSLLGNQKKLSYTFSLVCILLLLDSMLGFFPGINENIKTWMEQGVILTCAYFYAINLAIVISDKEGLKFFTQNIIFLAVVILVCGLYEFFFLGTQPGRIITGYQNISSTIILASIPLALEIKNINKWLKLSYIILSFSVLILLFKSRFITLIAFLYLIYLIFKNINARHIYKIITLILLLIVICLIFINIDRFANLLVGNDIWLRLFIWDRLIIAGMNNFIFGSGFGKISIISNSSQYINPSIELIIGLNTFHSAHNDLIEKFIYGGVLSLLAHLFINGLIIFGYFRYRKFNEEKIFLVYLFLFAASLTDVHNSNLSSLIFFHTIQLYLIIKIYENHNIRDLFLKSISFLILIPSFYFLFFNRNSISHINLYQSVSNEMIRGVASENRILELDSLAPHFMRIDFIKMQTYLIYKQGENFNKSYFEGLLLNTQKYNKYFAPQIQVASQYYSFVNNDEKYLNSLSDFLYSIGVNFRFINISMSGDRVKVLVSDVKNIHFMHDHDQVRIFIPYSLLEQLKIVNSSFGKNKLSSDQISLQVNNFVYTGIGDSSEAKELLMKFLNGINQISEKFVF